MRLRFSPRFYRLVQQLIVAAVMLILVLAGTNIRIVVLNPRALFIGISAIAFLAIGLAYLKNRDTVHLFVSQADLGWLAFVILTGFTVATAIFPRRSLEPWLFTVGLQLPLAYVTLYLLRRHWPEHLIVRGILFVGGYLYLLATAFTASYLLQVFQARGNGLEVPPFRLFTVLDNPSVLAMFIAITAPSIIGYTFTKISRIERSLAFLWLVGAAIAIIASGTRSGAIALLLGAAAALVLGAWAHPARPLSRVQNWANAHRWQANLLGVGSFVVMLTGLGIFFYVLSAAPNHADGSDRIELYRTALVTASQHLLTGLGPGAFMLAETQFHSVPPFFIVPHAHNMLMNSIAEGGLLGVAGLIVFAITVASVSIKAWRTQPERRPILAGAIGALVGFFASGLFESPMSQPGLVFLAAVQFMMIAAGLPAPKRSPVRQVIGLGVSMAIVIVLAGVLFFNYTRFWQVVYSDASTSTADSKAALAGAEKLDALKAADPADPLVMLQSAYAWAHVADLKDGQATAVPFWKTSADRLEQAIPYDPYLGLHYINLSALYTELGHLDDALRAARRATELSAKDPVAWLTLGMRLETSGDLANAQLAYIQSLTLEPHWAYVGFWQMSDIRKAALTHFKAIPELPGQRFDTLLVVGDEARTSGKTADALRIYADTLTAAVNPAQQVLIKGLIAWLNGDLKAAQASLTRASQLGAGTFSEADAWAYLSALASARGDQSEALSDCGHLHDMITSRGLTGFGSAQSIPYAIDSFWRFGLVSDYLPQVTVLDISPRYTACLSLLAWAKASAGDMYTAVRIYRAILRANPQDAETQKTLTALQPSGPN